MRIAVDAMGGDHAPLEVVKGAGMAAQMLGVEILLVGDEQQITPLLANLPNQGITVCHAPDVIGMGAHPLEAVRRQKDSSIVLAASAVRNGDAEALVSAGSTGAAMAAALLGWGRVKGVERPAIGIGLPTLSGSCMLLDAGAQVDARPSQLVQFAMMGSIYAERVMGKRSPRVGLLNVGEEETKGCELAIEVHKRLKAISRLNFIGNIEGRDVLPGKADVVVCDGFVGNVVLKFAEGMAETIFALLKEAVTKNLRSRVGALLLKDALQGVRARLDYTEYGGAPLLGLQGVCIISHGSSNATAVMNAIRVAKEAVEEKMVQHIEAAVAEWRNEQRAAR